MEKLPRGIKKTKEKAKKPKTQSGLIILQSH